MKQHPRDLFLISIFTTATKPTAPHHPLPATSTISGSDRVSPNVTCVRWLLTVESYKSVPKQRKEIQFPDICNNYPPLIKSPGLPSLAFFILVMHRERVAAILCVVERCAASAQTTLPQRNRGRKTNIAKCPFPPIVFVRLPGWSALCTKYTKLSSCQNRFLIKT